MGVVVKDDGDLVDWGEWKCSNDLTGIFDHTPGRGGLRVQHVSAIDSVLDAIGLKKKKKNTLRLFTCFQSIWITS